MARRLTVAALGAALLLASAAPAPARTIAPLSVPTPGYFSQLYSGFLTATPGASAGLYRPQPDQCGSDTNWCDTATLRLPDALQLRTAVVVTLTGTRQVDLLVYDPTAPGQPPPLVAHPTDDGLVAAFEALTSRYALVIAARTAPTAGYRLTVRTRTGGTQDGQGAFARSGVSVPVSRPGELVSRPSSRAPTTTAVTGGSPPRGPGSAVASAAADTPRPAAGDAEVPADVTALPEPAPPGPGVRKVAARLALGLPWLLLVAVLAGVRRRQAREPAGAPGPARSAGPSEPR